MAHPTAEVPHSPAEPISSQIQTQQAHNPKRRERQQADRRLRLVRLGLAEHLLGAGHAPLGLELQRAVRRQRVLELRDGQSDSVTHSKPHACVEIL